VFEVRSAYSLTMTSISKGPLHVMSFQKLFRLYDRKCQTYHVVGYKKVMIGLFWRRKLQTKGRLQSYFVELHSALAND